MEQQIRTTGIAETPALQVRLRRRSGERAAAGEIRATSRLWSSLVAGGRAGGAGRSMRASLAASSNSDPFVNPVAW